MKTLTIKIAEASDNKLKPVAKRQGAPVST